MTRKISYLTGIAGAALVLAAPAFGKPTPSEPQWQQAIDVRSQALNEQYRLGDFANSSIPIVHDHGDATAAKLVLQSTPSVPTVVRDHGDATQAKLAAQSAPADNPWQYMYTGSPQSSEPQWKKALMLRSQAFNEAYGPGLASTQVLDTSDPESTPAPVATTDSGVDIDWTQVGVAFGIGIVLALGLGLALRLRRPPLAH